MRDQISQKRRLQRGIFQQHAGVPVKTAGLIEKDTVQAVQRLGQAGQAQVERADANGNKVVDLAVHAITLLTIKRE
jgi:hypothetical protein